MELQKSIQAEKDRIEIEAEVNATIKLVMLEFERLASTDPKEACEPIEFNERRRALIRKLWNLAKECMRYGARNGS